MQLAQLVCGTDFMSDFWIYLFGWSWFVFYRRRYINPKRRTHNPQLALYWFHFPISDVWHVIESNLFTLPIFFLLALITIKDW